MAISQKIAAALAQVREKRPLIHHLTNYVTINDCANMTLAVGASPVMAVHAAEAAEMTSVASALVLNIGAIQSNMLESMLIAGKKANELGIPVIFDPVGVGATSFRTATAKEIIRKVNLAVIRGNMSEIKLLAGCGEGIRGVDSTAEEHNGEYIATRLSQQLGCVIAITGKTDIVAQGAAICRIDNGHPMLRAVTGTGCMASSLIGSCCGAADDSFIGAIAGISIMGIAGEIAQQSLQPGEGAGSFRIRLFDAVSNMTPEMILHYGLYN